MEYTGKTNISKKISSSLLVLSLAILATNALPSGVSATTLTTQTRQLLPLGRSTCPQITATSFVPYIYSNELNSFDITVSDKSYVAVLGSVGDTGIPFQFMTRRMDASGNLIIHVDTPSITVTQDLPIQVTLLSIRPDQTLCASLVSISLTSSSAGKSQNYLSTVGIKKSVTVTSHPTTPKVPVVPNKASTSMASSSTASTTSFSALSSVRNTLDKVCSTAGGSSRLWIVLLAVYIFSIIVVLLAQSPIENGQPQGFLIGAILLPLFVILAFWYFVPICRSGTLVPFIAIIAAAIGFIIGLRQQRKDTNLLVAKNPR